MEAFTIIGIVEEVSAAGVSSAFFSAGFRVPRCNISEVSSSWTTFLTFSEKAKGILGGRSSVCRVKVIEATVAKTFRAVRGISVALEALAISGVVVEEFASSNVVASVGTTLGSIR